MADSTCNSNIRVDAAEQHRPLWCRGLNNTCRIVSSTACQSQLKSVRQDEMQQQQHGYSCITTKEEAIAIRTTHMPSHNQCSLHTSSSCEGGAKYPNSANIAKS